MTSETNNLDQSYSDQLSDFEGQLKQTMDDESLLQDVHRAIRELLKEHSGSETDIRQILLERFKSGRLRQESFELVQQMIDRVVSDDIATLPGSDDADESNDSGFSETDVIPPSSVSSGLPEERLQIGSVLRDRFLLQQRVAGGSMGVVYKALDRRLAEADGGDPWVAIKVLSPKLSRNGNALRALQQEAAKGRCLTHPNIVRFLDLDREDELYFIVMEWLEGRSLANVLDDANSKKLDVNTALDIATQIGNALDYAHRCGVVHADVKPGNVILTPAGNVKLFDFGVARVRQKQSDSLSKFDPSVLGAKTPAYSSMQVLTGEEPVPADDVFSLACLLYRLIAGYRVFGPRNAAEAAESGMEPQRPQGLSDSQWKALKKALAYSRVARYSSPKAFTDDLLKAELAPEVITSEVRVEVTDQDTAIHEFSQPEKTRWPLIAGLGLVAVLAYVGTSTDLISRYIPEGSILGGIKPADMPAVESSSKTANAQSTEDASSVSSSIIDEPQAAISGTGESAEIIREEPPIISGDVESEAVSGIGSPELNEEFASEAVSRIGSSELNEEFVDRADTEILVDDYSDVFAESPEEIEELVFDVPQVSESLLEATHSLDLAGSGSAIDEIDVILREGQGPAVINLRRFEQTDIPLTLRIAEIGFSGNQSPWSAGEYDIAGNGIVEFSANQEIAQIVISAPSDLLNEADLKANLLVRYADTPESELAQINLFLEDDDRRVFEANLPSNTVGFSSDRAIVRENDPAVQIDLVRFNSDGQPLDVHYVVRDITATESDDYFSPGVTTVSFAPRQHLVRLLIPLVQDSTDEIDETFSLEIVSGATSNDPNINRQITVMIRDDDFGPE